VRVAETTTARTWPTIRTTLQRLHLITFTGPADTFRATTELTKMAIHVSAAAGLDLRIMSGQVADSRVSHRLPSAAR
jgi:hypothetical protein